MKESKNYLDLKQAVEKKNNYVEMRDVEILETGYCIGDQDSSSENIDYYYYLLTLQEGESKIYVIYTSDKEMSDSKIDIEGCLVGIHSEDKKARRKIVQEIADEDEFTKAEAEEIVSSKFMIDGTSDRKFDQKFDQTIAFTVLAGVLVSGFAILMQFYWLFRYKKHPVLKKIFSALLMQHEELEETLSKELEINGWIVDKDFLKVSSRFVLLQRKFDFTIRLTSELMWTCPISKNGAIDKPDGRIILFLFKSSFNDFEAIKCRDSKERNAILDALKENFPSIICKFDLELMKLFHSNFSEFVRLWSERNEASGAVSEGGNE